MLLIWGWVIGLVLIGVGRSLSSISGTFNCGFEAIGNNVYFDMMNLLLPFCVFEFEVIIIVLSIMGQWSGVVLVIVVVILVELVSNSFGV